MQYLDDLDDFYGMFGLIGERLRSFGLIALSGLSVVAVAAVASWLAFVHPPVALATLTLLFVTLLYRSVTVPSPHWQQSAR